MAIFLAERDEAKKAYEEGAIEKGTVIPEFDAESKEESQ
jgi:hypothetical protein